MSVNIWDQRSTCKPLCSTDLPTQPTQHTPAPAAHRYCPFIVSKKLDSQLLLKAESCCWGGGGGSFGHCGTQDLQGPCPKGLCGAEHLWSRVIHQAVVLG